MVFLATILIKTAEKECKGTKIKEIQFKSLNAFMDDMSVNAANPKEPGEYYINSTSLRGRKLFKPTKHKKYRSLKTDCIEIVNKTDNCIGKRSDHNLRDTDNSRKHQSQVARSPGVY